MRSQNRGQKHSTFDQRRFPDHSSFSIDSGPSNRMKRSLKTNDGYIAATLKIEQNLGACHHFSNCFDIISGDHQLQ